MLHILKTNYEDKVQRYSFNLQRCSGMHPCSQPNRHVLAQDQWFSPGTPASSTTKTGRHDIAEILLKVALNTKIQIQIHSSLYDISPYYISNHCVVF
jgi:hypothetical protein